MELRGSIKGIGSLVLAAVIGGATCVSAAGLGNISEEVMINGFVSQGYLNTNKVDFLVPDSRNGSAEFLEAALTATVQPSERLRIAVQFLARNFGDTGQGNVALDWGYGDYRWRDELGVRAGKIKLPYGLYNEVRDLDFLRTAVFLPQSVYNERMRDFLLAYEGVGAYGSFILGSAGELDYHVYGGTLNVAEPDRGFWGDNTAGARTLEPAVAAQVEEDAAEAGQTGTAEASLAAVVDPRVQFPYVWGGSATWTSPLESLRLSSTLVTGRFTYTADFRYDVTFTPDSGPATFLPYVIEFDDDQDINRVVTVSGEYAKGPWLLAAEYSETEIEDTRTDGWYAAAESRVIDPLSLSLVYGAYYDDKNDRGGKQVVEFGLPEHYAWQKDWTVAARWDITDRWLIKAEYHFIDGVALSLSQSLYEELANPKSRHWTMFAAKTTFHF